MPAHRLFTEIRSQPVVRRSAGQPAKFHGHGAGNALPVVDDVVDGLPGYVGQQRDFGLVHTEAFDFRTKMRPGLYAATLFRWNHTQPHR